MKNDQTKNHKTCTDCNHDFHRAGDCDRCNCGEAELVYSKHYVASQLSCCVDALRALYNAVDSAVELTPEVMQQARAALKKGEK